MIDAPSLTAAFLTWIGCSLPMCESVIDRVAQAKAQAKGVIMLDQRIAIPPGKKVIIDGREITISGYEDCAGITTAPVDAKKCVVFGRDATTAMVDMMQGDGSSTTELWRSWVDGRDFVIARPSGDVVFRLDVPGNPAQK